jgi:hypothetical protein
MFNVDILIIEISQIGKKKDFFVCMIFIKVMRSGNSSLYFSVDSKVLRLICILSSHGEDDPIFVIYFVLLFNESVYFMR